MKKDEVLMKQAIKIAQRAKGKTGVNPLVGCIIEKNGKLSQRDIIKAPGSTMQRLMQ